MHIKVEPYGTVKAGNRGEEYEDALAHRMAKDGDRASNLFAVADGATVSWHPAIWARLLVESVVDGGLDLTNLESLISLQQEWIAAVAVPFLPWYAEEMASKGAFATLLVLELVETPDRQWRAMAVGDTCLFHIREGELRISFPHRRSVDFNSHPNLIGSRTDFRELMNRIVHETGSWEPGDEFLMMTDALAHWFLSEVEAGRQPQKELVHLSGREDEFHFRNWVDQLRQSRAIRNDDTTLLRITIEG